MYLKIGILLKQLGSDGQEAKSSKNRTCNSDSTYVNFSCNSIAPLIKRRWKKFYCRPSICRYSFLCIFQCPIKRSSVTTYEINSFSVIEYLNDLQVDGLPCLCLFCFKIVVKQDWGCGLVWRVLKQHAQSPEFAPWHK